MSGRTIRETLAALGVIASVVFVGLEIRQNTSQLRANASQAITAMVNELNAGMYLDSTLADLVLRGERELDALSPTERARFDTFQFARLNVAEYVLDLETEGVSDFNFRYVDYTVREFQTKPGLEAFIRSYEDTYVGSPELLARLIGQ